MGVGQRNELNFKIKALRTNLNHGMRKRNEKLCETTNEITYNLDHRSKTTALLLFSVQVNLCQKLFFLQNMGRTCCVQKLL